MLKFGTYRVYIKLGSFGIKIAKPALSIRFNSICIFFVGIVMNILEYKRYRRFVLGKYTDAFAFKPSSYALCPTYFSCGLFNIVKHAEPRPSDWESIYFKNSEIKYRKSPFCESEDNDSSFGILNGEVVEVDYGDFSVYANRQDSVITVDYK